MTPEIDSLTAIAMCKDRYLGAPAEDDPVWQGADETSRSCVWGEWAFCYSPHRQVVHGQHESGASAVAFLVGAVACEWEEL